MKLDCFLRSPENDNGNSHVLNIQRDSTVEQIFYIEPLYDTKYKRVISLVVLGKIDNIKNNISLRLDSGQDNCSKILIKELNAKKKKKTLEIEIEITSDPEQELDRPIINENVHAYTNTAVNIICPENVYELIHRICNSRLV